MDGIWRSYAQGNPTRWVELSNETGIWQVFGCEGTERWQLTDAPSSVATMVTTYYGDIVAWWQDDNDGWQVQEFRSRPGSHKPLSRDLPRAQPDGGLVFRSDRATVPLAEPGQPAKIYYVENGRVIQVWQREPPSSEYPAPDSNFAISIRRVWPAMEHPLREYSHVAQLPPGSPAQFPTSHLWSVVKHEPQNRRMLALIGQPMSGTGKRHFFPLPYPPAGELTDLWSNHLHVHGPVLTFSFDGERLVAGFDDGPNTRLYEIDLTSDSFTWQQLPTPDGRITAVNFIGPEGKTLEYRWGAIGNPWQFLKLGETPLASTGTKWEHIKVPWEDGPEGAPEIPVTLVYPDGDPPPEGWPVAIVAHGGPHIHAGNQPLDPAEEELRKNNVLLAFVEYPGSTGYGRAYRRAAFGNLGVTEGNSLRTVARWLKNSNLPIQHKFAWTGGSYAGLPVLIGAALAAENGEEDLVGAIALRAPECDPMETWEKGTARTRDVLETRIGGSPSEVPDKWRAAAPVTYSHLLRCPTLLIRHHRDRHVSNDSMEKVRLSNPRMVRLVDMADGHNARSQSTTVAAKSDKTRVEFLLHHLQPESAEPPRPGRPARTMTVPPFTPTRNSSRKIN